MAVNSGIRLFNRFPTREEVFNMAAPQLQNLLRNFLGWHPDLALHTSRFLYHVEFSTDLSEWTVELTSPDLLKMLLGIFFPGGHINFIICLRKFLGVPPRRSYIDENPYDSPYVNNRTISIATFIFWNLRIAVNCVYPYNHFVIHPGGDWCISNIIVGPESTLNFNVISLLRPSFPWWRIEWGVNPHFGTGNFRRRFLNRLILGALHRAQRKLDDRLSKHARLIVANWELDTYYRRTKSILEQRIASYEARLHRSRHRIYRLRAQFIFNIL